MAKPSFSQITAILKQFLLLATPLLLRWWRNRQSLKQTQAPRRERSAGNRGDRPVRTKTPSGGGNRGRREGASGQVKGGTTGGTRGGLRGGARGGLPRREAPPTKAKRRLVGSSVAEQFRRKRSDVILEDRGTVVHLLPDDREGSRHQRFLVEVARSDVTIKIAHNIDLAPRVPVSKGDRIKFKGEYEYNELGGAVHWTHHDPKRWREGGWIQHRGKRYE